MEYISTYTHTRHIHKHCVCVCVCVCVYIYMYTARETSAPPSTPTNKCGTMGITIAPNIAPSFDPFNPILTPNFLMGDSSFPNDPAPTAPPPPLADNVLAIDAERPAPAATPTP